MPGTPRSWDMLADLNGALINSNMVVDYPRLLPETFVNVGGMQIRGEPKPLPKVVRLTWLKVRRLAGLILLQH